MPLDETSAQTLSQFATFRLGDEEYAVPVAQVQEIVRLSTITAVPGSPRFVEGVVNLRGRILPVIDLARRFALPAGARTRATRIIVVQLEGRLVGMRVDAVMEVLQLEAGAIEPTPAVLRQGTAHAHIAGIGKLEGRLLIMLDLARVLSTEDVEALPAS